ncbi:cytochrome P450 [Xylariomycetidae sp. FL2044]|nr:cytochrome P450 [Xylariomycetidae sp. FL2044]
MVLSLVDSSNITSFAAVLAVVLTTHLIWTWIRLRRIPGPFWAKITNIPRAYWVWTRSAHEIHIPLHEKYDKLVRFGPNMVSVQDPSEISKIYRMYNPLLKASPSDFYHVILPMSKAKVLPGLFATQDEKLHRMLKKPIASVYSMSNLTSFELLVDTTIEVFLGQLRTRFVEPAKFDVVGEITFSRRLGFMEQGVDIDGIMASIWHWFEYVAVVGQIPWVDYLWVKNPIVSRLRPAKWSPMVRFAVKQQQEREKQLAEGKAPNQRDFLGRFLAVMSEDSTIPAWALPAWTSSNILAGSDTTTIMLRTIFKMLMMHPKSLASLMDETDEARRSEKLSRIASWKESRQLPYLDACIKEAGRLHPPFGLNLERVVPPEGMELCGETIPAGTIVGMNAWVRWLTGDAADIKKMESSLLTFGAGHRTCLGKHISLLEIYKLVPTILQHFELESAHKDTIWEVQNRWFVPQSNFDVHLKVRKYS